jgi:hypothetical protein
MELKEIINNLENLSAVDIVNLLCEKNISYEVFSAAVKDQGGWDSAEKRKKIQSLFKQKDDDAYKAAVNANTAAAFQNYLLLYPNGNHIVDAESKVQQIQIAENIEIGKSEERERVLRQVKEDINEYTHDEIIEILGSEAFDELCYELGIDAQMVTGYKEPFLKFNDIPQSAGDVPSGYTDVFFWGIPSSGKTCALSAIFSTIKKDCSMEAPDCEKKFGATYRDSLINIFNKDYGYLPGRTNEDRTQYMPFLFYKRGEKRKRKISFFELSGEVFKYFYEVANNSKIIDDYSRADVEKSFQTLKLILESNNQKIHFFFIDYNQETKYTTDENNLTQGNYLEAAKTYFRDNKEIFKKRTDAVYVILTKSDEIKGNDKAMIAKSFLSENFGSFMDVLKNQCDSYSVDFKVKLFSIGNVYFKKICKINRSYSTDIINDLLERVKPMSDTKIGNFFRS